MLTFVLKLSTNKQPLLWFETGIFTRFWALKNTEFFKNYEMKTKYASTFTASNIDRFSHVPITD